MKARLKSNLRVGAGEGYMPKSRDVEVIYQEDHSIYGTCYRILGCNTMFEENAFEYIEGLFESKNCNDCKYVSLTEEQQINKKIPHECTKHKCIVVHRAATITEPHTWIYPCTECNGKDFDSRD